MYVYNYVRMYVSHALECGSRGAGFRRTRRPRLMCIRDALMSDDAARNRPSKGAGQASKATTKSPTTPEGRDFVVCADHVCMCDVYTR